jgi:DNA-binding response OmpR family regulator
MPPRIMIVDDDRDICEVLAHRLEAMGYEHIVANDGKTALALLGLEVLRSPIAGIFLDVHMPGMDGVQVLLELRVQHPNVPVVMMSAHPDRRVLEEAVKAGASQYLVKPFDMEELARLCQEIFRLSAGEA